MTDVRRAIDLSPHHQIRVVLNSAGNVDIRLWRRSPETRTLRSTSAGFLLSLTAARKLGTMLQTINKAY